MDVNNPKLHICSGNKFVDYEITIEVGISVFWWHENSKNYRIPVLAGRRYWISNKYFSFFNQTLLTFQTTNKAFFRKCSSVRRRYSDFCWLRGKLSSTEINGFGRYSDWPLNSLNLFTANPRCNGHGSWVTDLFRNIACLWCHWDQYF